MEDQGKSVRLVYTPTTKFKDKLHLHLEGDHFCWIKSIKLYSNSYKCNYCDKLFKDVTAMRRHTLSCQPTTKLIFPKREFSNPKHIMERLKEDSIFVDESRRYYPYIAVFDCEVYFEDTNLPANTTTLTWDKKHTLASICSRIHKT